MRRSRSNSVTSAKLEYYHRLVSKTILDLQHPITGLLPASLFEGKFDTNSIHFRDAWVRDNVYSSLAIWGLSLAYKKNSDADEDRARVYELEQCVVKLMRSLLTSMMQQVEKVEKFKKTQATEDALHAKFNRATGATVVTDSGWGHLQIDATSLYLLMLAEMTAAGLQIIYTYDEVAFVQNLVFYIEMAYRTPDYGITERGGKTNSGNPELNTSSIGMAKAALEALSGLDLFGAHGGPRSTIQVQPDQIQFCKAILQSMLPKESDSKEIGASLLSVISFPAFAVEDKDLVKITKSEIIGRLEGKYGMKRFLRDGYQTPKEDRNRLYYEPSELKQFENIECEWPVFFIYMLLDGIYNDIEEQVEDYSEKLKPLLVETNDGLVLVPELYAVPKDKVEEEYRNPHSQERKYGNYCPQLWSQSLYILSGLLIDNLIAVGELDPLNRRYSTDPRPDLVVQVSVIAEDEFIKDLLDQQEVPCQTPAEADPIRVLPAKCLSKIYSELGKNSNLGLSGRPAQNIGLVGTGCLYRVDGSILSFTPQFLDYLQFYLCLDNELLVDAFKTEIEYLRANWRMVGRPTLVIPITHAILEDNINSTVGKFLLRIKCGYSFGVRVRLGKLADLLSTSCIQKLDFVEKHKLQELIHRYRDPYMSPRMSDVLKVSANDEFDDLYQPCKKPGPSEDVDTMKRTSSVSGSVMLSRKLSRMQSWGQDERNRSYSPKLYDLHEVSKSISQKPVTDQASIDSDDLRKELEEADSIYAQADILHHLYVTKGPKFDVKLRGVANSTVEILLQELYEKASHYKIWSLIRHTAGMLGKTVDNLGEVANDLLVRQKQLGVGLPHMNSEIEITRPSPPSELKNYIYKSAGEDRSTAVLMQELLVYLSMFVKTEPTLFNEMLRLRVGLIMEVMAAEFARATSLTGEEAAEGFMNLKPFEMKQLLYHILSGNEITFKRDASGSYKIANLRSINKVKRAVKSLKKSAEKQMHPLHDEKFSSDYSSGEEENDDVRASDENAHKAGQWMRRRCLDGALNRVPVDFYFKIWKILERCNGIRIHNYVCEHALVKEMTPNELNFAIKVEAGLNCITHPEYRQLMVEALMMLSLVLEHDGNIFINDVITIDKIVYDANNLFLEHQKQCSGDASTCCAKSDSVSPRCGATNQICRHFYDSAPSGSYGTMTFFAQAILKKINLGDPGEICKILLLA
eukprot:Seg208.3_Seg208.2_Seg208.5 transcript_id=Seg208.3_Seg208.2_Seg208.5/GoldUCD/mRNA.D3Y31 product="Phosphorylase b kinase regulatory subunit alpha liver isoform" protein_id=Seg208.3_Seg208.2_Seg208.5/GoldUCD/D3Y31